MGLLTAHTNSDPMRMIRAILTVMVVALAFVLEPQIAQAQRATQIGTLTCRMGPRVGALVGSRQRLDCRYRQNQRDGVEHYSGTITRFGFDIGLTGGGVMIWRVLARTRGQRHGALAGHYVGASADVSLGLGAGAKVLIGGSRRSVVLQPVSLVGKVGVNFALGVSGLTLRFNSP